MHFMGLKEETTWTNIKNKFNIDNYFSRGDGPIYSQDDLRRGWIGFVLSLAQSKTALLILCTIRSLVIQIVSINTQFLFFLILALALQEVPLGKLMLNISKRPRTQLRHYGKHLPPPKCLPSLNLGK